MNQDIEQRLARLEAQAERQDIADCLTRFCRGMDRFDRALFLSAFHDDATIAAGPFVGGPVALYDWAMPLHESGQISTQHNLLNMTIDVDGEIAHAETHYLFVGRNRDESLWMAGGRYLDRLEKRAGDWRIALRTNIIEWSALPPPLPLPFADLPGVHDNGAAARNLSDPSYARPLTNVRASSVP
jgi:ketosteroid isomerase-like protein